MGFGWDFGKDFGGGFGIEFERDYGGDSVIDSGHAFVICFGSRDLVMSLARFLVRTLTLGAGQDSDEGSCRGSGRVNGFELWKEFGKLSVARMWQ